MPRCEGRLSDASRQYIRGISPKELFYNAISTLQTHLYA